VIWRKSRFLFLLLWCRACFRCTGWPHKIKKGMLKIFPLSLILFQTNKGDLIFPVNSFVILNFPWRSSFWSSSNGQMSIRCQKFSCLTGPKPLVTSEPRPMSASINKESSTFYPKKRREVNTLLDFPPFKRVNAKRPSIFGLPKIALWTPPQHHPFTHFLPSPFPFFLASEELFKKN